MSAPTDPTLRLAGRFELQPRERRLLVDGNLATLGARAFDLLRYFAERPGRLVSKQELLDAVWADVVVEENNLQQQVSVLRKLLGADAIETIPGFGYRFVARVDANRRLQTPGQQLDCPLLSRRRRARQPRRRRRTCRAFCRR